MKYRSENFDVAIRTLLTSIDFIDKEIQDKMKFIVARPSIPAVTGFHEAHRLDNMYMSYYIFKNNILRIYEIFLESLNAVDLQDVPNLDHETIIKVKHRRITIAETIKMLIENMVVTPDFSKIPHEEKYIKTQYIIYLDFIEKMHLIDIAINNYVDKNMDKMKVLSHFDSFVNVYINDISKDTYALTFSKFGQLLIKSTFNHNDFYPQKK